MAGELSFKEAPLPEKTRNSQTSERVSKHIPMIKEMIATSTSRTVTMPYKTDGEKAEVRFLINDMQRAGRECEVTVKKLVTELTGNQAGKVSVQFWTREKITRPPRNK